MLFLLLTTSVAGCIKNDIPYPRRLGKITAFEVSGQIGGAVIDSTARTVSVEVADTVDLAQRNPAFDYVGVVIKGARLWKGAKYATEYNLGNVAFLRTRIEFIGSLFAPDEVSEIWITFADPQLKKPKKRLTSPLFLERYRNLLKKGGIVHLKTDSRLLHEYTRAVVEQNGLKMLACATDIYGADREKLYGTPLESICGRDAVDALFQVQTFYESQYLAQGIPITYMSFLIDHEGPYAAPDFDEDSWER